MGFMQVCGLPTPQPTALPDGRHTLSLAIDGVMYCVTTPESCSPVRARFVLAELLLTQLFPGTSLAEQDARIQQLLQKN
eukprot:NODE_8988_length_335_cov_70.108392_g7227_i0.p1 GENE.NODE_8988_length_335_cov_70.108392_g7227_i0~~NODE_8988_length_335_cov_70.108392_g7227_i0.p1  ORF type:complete len:89 (+),score=34.15 NODE_8988_length_335_cov_70.108392_g7227_i0:31-267(+)